MKKLIAAGLLGIALLQGCNRNNENLTINGYINSSNNNFINLEERTEADNTLINFPDKILGAKSVNKYLTPNSNHYLVHLRQIHLNKNLSPSELEGVKNVQDNIYKILSYLTENKFIDKVYDEGLTPPFAAIKSFCARINSESEDIEKIKKEYPNMYEHYLFFQNNKNYDAIYRVASENSNLEILSPEDPNLLKEAEFAYNRLRGFGFFRWITEREKSFNAICENRENNVLKEIGKENSPLAVVVYGTGHAFGGKISCGRDYDERWRDSICDNITKWNSENPNEKFSLIEVEPFGL